LISSSIASHIPVDVFIVLLLRIEVGVKALFLPFTLLKQLLNLRVIVLSLLKLSQLMEFRNHAFHDLVFIHLLDRRRLACFTSAFRVASRVTEILFLQVVLDLEVDDPRVLEHFHERHAFARLDLQQRVDKVFVLVGNRLFELYALLEDLLDNGALVLSCEGRFPVHQFKEQNSQAPNVECVVVRLVLQHFRSHVLQSSTEGAPALSFLQAHAPAEVADLEQVALAYDHVLGFDVSVNESVLLEEVHPAACLDKEVKGFVFVQRSFASYQTE